MNTFCPLYNEAVEATPWKRAGTAHAGLLFDKFANRWSKEDWTFDKNAWLKDMPNTVGHGDHLTEATHRQAELIESLGGKLLFFKNTDRFVTGLGRTHPIENGFTFHPTLGLPYLPGSGVKGVLAAWLREDTDQWDGKNHQWKEGTAAACWFGAQDHAGSLIFLDLLPTAPPGLEADIMTPHYGRYYQDGKGETPPADWHVPNPIPFLTVAAWQSWQTGILPAPGSSPDPAELGALAGHLQDALAWLGAGAKTAVGYGRFDRDEDNENEVKTRRAEAAAERQQERDREQKLAKLDPAVADLVRRADDEGWAETEDRNAFLDGAEKYLEGQPEPSTKCIDWLGDQLVRLWPAGGAHGDIWNDPDAMKGKNKDRPVHKSKRARDLVERLQSVLNDSGSGSATEGDAQE